MRTSQMARLLLGGLLVASAALAGCGDDEPKVATRGGGPAGPAKATAKAKAKAKSVKSASGLDESKLPVKFRGLTPEDWEIEGDLAVRIREGRDPFLPYVADLVAVEVEDDQRQEERIRLGIKIAVPVRQLKFIAVISGTGVPRAMVEDGNGVGHILRPGDVVGDDVPYRVARITRNQVVFKPLQAPDGDEKIEEVTKVLLTQEELAELLP